MVKRCHIEYYARMQMANLQILKIFDLHKTKKQTKDEE